MTRSVVTAVAGFLAGWVLVPSLLGLSFEVDGFAGPTNALVVLGYLLMSALWPIATIGLGLWLGRLWTGLAAFGVGVVTAVVMLGIFA